MHFDQAIAIFDSNSEEAWGETRVGVSPFFPHPLPTHFFQVNMAANLRSRALKKTPALQARRAMTQFVLVVQSLPKSPRSYFCLFRAM